MRGTAAPFGGRPLTGASCTDGFGPCRILSVQLPEVDLVRTFLTRSSFAALAVAIVAQVVAAQSPAMQWRQIGPNRAGRGRAATGVPTQPNVAYVGFDNGGVWRSTDYGNNWEPIFDKEGTGSIGAIAV